MWFICLMSFVNAITSTRGFQNKYRINLGAGVQIGILEALLVGGLLVALIRGSATRAKTPTMRMHRMYLISLSLMLLAFLIDSLLALPLDCPIRDKIVFMREFFGMPACLFMGYQLLGTLQQVRKFLWAIVFSGIGVSIMLMLFFNANAERYEVHNDLSAMRTVSYVSNYAGLACAFLIVTVLLGFRMMPVVMSLAVAGFCFVGQLTPLHRADWASLCAALGIIPIIMPAGERVRQFFRLILALLALSASLWIGLHAASAVTGKNFHATFEKRIVSMLPTERSTTGEQKAWDTRWPAIYHELGMWIQSPIWGNGFGSEEASGLNPGMANHHNAYTSTLAQTGLIGTVGVVMTVWAPFFVGLKLVRARYDRESMLLGAIGVVASAQFAVLGMATASFNGYRWAMVIGTIAGMCFRARDIQLTALAESQQFGTPYGLDQTTHGHGFPVEIPEFDDFGRPIEYPAAHGHAYN